MGPSHVQELCGVARVFMGASEQLSSATSLFAVGTHWPGRKAVRGNQAYSERKLDHILDMSLKLTTPESFPGFPFLPYDIQLTLMQHLYENIENRRVTVIESPTGTVSNQI